LEKRAREILEAAQVVLASKRLSEVFQRYDDYEKVKGRIKIIDKVPETVGFIKERLSEQSQGPIVLLASGDPLFFGIGRRIREEFGKEPVELWPDLSSMQGAFARIQEPWDDAFFMSLHGGPDIAKRRKLPYVIKDIPELLAQHGKLGILTDRENNPVQIARALQAANAGSPILMTVCERIGYPEERLVQESPDKIAGMSFSDPNVVIVQMALRKAPAINFGLKEDEISHDRGLITKDEVRAVTLHKLRLPSTGVFWDIGAGSGSVSLEAARLCPGMKVFAIEKEPGRIETIAKNIESFKVRNVQVIQGAAPEMLKILPDPDRVFIGGSDGNLERIVMLVNERMRSGIVVINAVTLETLNHALTALETNGFTADVTEISLSRSKNMAGKRHMAALNPVFIIKGEKG
jgi:precorrin-6Y C5,15-methyltransferase (decarboxylating)